jgi:hypothetical protein
MNFGRFQIYLNQFKVNLKEIKKTLCSTGSTRLGMLAALGIEAC